jgi:hypothetical protein
MYDTIKYRVHRCNHLYLFHQHIHRVEVHIFFMCANFILICENCILYRTKGVPSSILLLVTTSIYGSYLTHVATKPNHPTFHLPFLLSLAPLVITSILSMWCSRSSTIQPVVLHLLHHVALFGCHHDDTSYPITILLEV